MGTHVTLQRVALIKQLHRIQSVSAKATCFGNKTVISSLLLGDYFIHGYHFGIPDEVSKSFLILQTFSKHGNASYGCMHMGVRLGEVVQKTRSYLTVSWVSMYHGSFFFQYTHLKHKLDG